MQQMLEIMANHAKHQNSWQMPKFMVLWICNFHPALILCLPLNQQ